MALGVYFNPVGMSTSKYDDVMKQLDAAGASTPKGRSHHSAFGPAEALMVYDVWDSQEDFDAFGATLMPILGGLGIDIGQPQAMPIHNIVQP
jgi:hypothetical protein